jgi:hypothetical protein
MEKISVLYIDNVLNNVSYKIEIAGYRGGSGTYKFLTFNLNTRCFTVGWRDASGLTRKLGNIDGRYNAVEFYNEVEL